jgi:hypothetical protein
MAGAALTAPAASAAGVSLTYGPTPTSATTINIDPLTSATTAGAAYGLKLVGTSSTVPRVNALSGPTGGVLYYQRVAANAAPGTTPAGGAFGGTATATAGTLTFSTASDPAALVGHAVKISKAGEITEIAVVASQTGAGPYTVTLDRPVLGAHTAATVTDLGATGGINPFYTVAPGATSPVTNFAAADNLYFNAVVPGAYTFQLFVDSNGNNVYDSAQDDASPVFTLNVKDVTANTTTTTDDWAPTITVPSSLGKGQAVTASVSTGDLTTVDTRGANGVSGKNKLGEALASATTIAFAQTAGIGDVAAAPSFDGSSLTRTSSTVTSATNPVVTTIAGIASSNVTRSTTIVDNGVTVVTSGATDVAGSAKRSGAAVAVKTGTADVTYTATVDAGTDDSGKTVYFTLTPSTNTPALTADGTLVSSVSGVKVYSAVTNASGVASLKVTSGTTTAGTIYTVGIKSNNIQDLANPTLTATYADAAASSFTVTTPTAGLSPTVGNSVTIAGTLVDQFASTFQPPASAAQQVTITIDQNNTAYGAADVTGYATLAAGAFSYTYTPATNPAAGRQDVVHFVYGAATPLDSSVYWTTSEAAATVTISAPVSGAAPTQQKATLTPAAGTAVTGSILNASSAGLAYKTVTLTGTPGVYFSDVATPTTATTDDLKSSFTVAANASGSYTAYAFFTKIGAATVTATSGTAKASVDVAVAQASDPYQAIAIDAAVEPGGTSVVTGEVKNGWGHPVSGASVSLSLGSTKIATLGATTVTTNADGVWSTTLTGASGGDGEATLTATLTGQTVNAAPHANWLLNAGLVVPTGFYYDTAKITVDPNINKTTVSAPASRAGAGAVKLTGKATPRSTVEIYAKPAGTGIAYALVGVATADADGDWTSTEYVNSTTVFYAKTTTSSSTPITVKVTVPAVPPTPKFNVGAKPLGSGKVAITATGNGDTRSVVTIYQVVGKKTVKVTTVKVDGKGVARATIKTSKGSKTYKVVYINGYKNGSKTIKVTVK